jgi:hypothetical protein
MNDRDKDSVFRNPATRARRAWIDRALASARETLAAGNGPEPCEYDPTAGTRAEPGEGSAPAPRLRVVPGPRDP